MSKVRELCQLTVKADLKFLILEKTAENRQQCPTVKFERLKLASKDNGDKKPASIF